jgi:maltodextrin utilization protein YvdJ
MNLSHFLKANGDTMNNKIKTFGKAFYDNSALFKLTKIPLFLLALMLFVNVSLVSAPNFIGYMEGISVVDSLDGIDEAFVEMYESELECKVNDANQMECNGTPQSMYGDYHFRFQNTLDVSGINESTIIFTPDKAVIIYQGNSTAVLDGDYSLMQGFDFSTVKDESQNLQSMDAFYQDNTDFFLEYLYYSDLGQNIGIVYAVQFAQTFLYVVIVSLLIQMVNFKASIKKVTYQAALRITILAMTGPALLAALLGLWFAGWAYLIFTLIYLIRIIVIYYSINRRSETLVGPNETPEIREDVE